MICPRCKALINASDGQPFGVPRFYSPLTVSALNTPDSELVVWSEVDTTRITNIGTDDAIHKDE